MDNKASDSVDTLLSLVSKITTGSLVFLLVGIGIYKAISSDTTAEMLGYLLGGFIGGLLMLLTSFSVDLGFNAWEKSISWLAKPIRKYPYGRFWIIVPNILLGFYTAYLVFRFVNIDWSLKAFIGL